MFVGWTLGISRSYPSDCPRKPVWSTVFEIYERQLSKVASGLGGVTPHSTNRLCFPVSIPAFVLDPVLLEQRCFNEGLVLSGGHALVYAWYLGVWASLKTTDEEWLRRLWECGLTVTVRLRQASTNDPRSIILDSLHYSEACQVAKLANTDSFSVFTLCRPTERGQ